MSSNLCDYGCGKIATHTFKNGKKCCSKTTNGCSEVNKTRLLGLIVYAKELSSSIDPQTGLSLSTIKALKREEKKRDTIDLETGLTMNTVGAMRAAKTKANTIDPDTGFNTSQLAGLKSYQTTTTTIDPVTGLTLREIQDRNHSKNLLQVNPKTGLTKGQEAGLKCLKTKLQVDENGLNSFERGYMKSLKMYYYRNTKILYQGSCELQFLTELDNEYGINWVIKNVKRGPNIKYYHPIEKREKCYMVDYEINNILYEIKSTYTWDGQGRKLEFKDINVAKMIGATQSGYTIFVLIY